MMKKQIWSGIAKNGALLDDTASWTTEPLSLSH